MIFRLQGVFRLSCSLLVITNKETEYPGYDSGKKQVRVVVPLRRAPTVGVHQGAGKEATKTKVEMTGALGLSACSLHLRDQQVEISERYKPFLVDRATACNLSAN